MDRFLYDRDIRHKRVTDRHQISLAVLMLILTQFFSFPLELIRKTGFRMISGEIDID